MEDPDAERCAYAPAPLPLGELVGAQSVLLLRIVALLVPGLTAAATASVLEQVWAEYLASLFDPGEGGPVTTGLLTVLVHRCRDLTGQSGADDLSGPDPVAAERFRPEEDRWRGAWRVGEGPRRWLPDARRPAWTRQAVESLPLPVREVLVLRDTAGLSAAEVGIVLQRPEPEVRALLHRARSTVWAELERRHVEAGRLRPAGPDEDPDPPPPGTAGPYPGDAGHRVICCRLVELLTEYVEGTLDAALAADLEAHLAACPECRLFVQQVRDGTTQSARLAAVHRLPPDLVGTVVRRLHGILQPGAS